MVDVKHVRWMVEATVTSMGMHHYERQIQSALSAVAGDGWSFSSTRVGTLRSPDAADLRVPAQLTRRGPSWAMRLAGAKRSRGVLVHRFDLRLPPAPREVITAHDLPPMHFPDEGSLAPWTLNSLRRARQVIVPSEFAASEIRKFGRTDAVSVIPYGLTDGFIDARPADDELLERLGIRRPFLIHAAGATRRKNLHGLGEAWARVAESGMPEHQLVLCGPAHPNRDSAFQDAQQVVMPGRQPLTVVASLMAASAGVVVPSLYEGFGLPALEGMATGAPVLAAAAGALPEVCGDAALLVPATPDGLAEGLQTLMALSPDEAARLGTAGRARARTFDWARAARQHLGVYEQFC